MALAAVGDFTLELTWPPETAPGAVVTNMARQLGHRVTVLEEPGKTDVTVTVPGITQKSFSWAIREET